MGSWIIWVYLNCPLEFFARLRPLPQLMLSKCQSRMRFYQRGVKLKSALGKGPGFGNRFDGRSAGIITQYHITITEPRISERVIRIFVSRLLKLVHRFAD